MQEIAEFKNRILHSFKNIKDIREHSSELEMLSSWNELSISHDSWESGTNIFRQKFVSPSKRVLTSTWSRKLILL